MSRDARAPTQGMHLQTAYGTQPELELAAPLQRLQLPADAKHPVICDAFGVVVADEDPQLVDGDGIAMYATRGG